VRGDPGGGVLQVISRELLFKLRDSQLCFVQNSGVRARYRSMSSLTHSTLVSKGPRWSGLLLTTTYQSTGRFRMKKDDFLPRTSRCFLSLSMWATSAALLFLSMPHFLIRVLYILTLGPVSMNLLRFDPVLSGDRTLQRSSGPGP